MLLKGYAVRHAPVVVPGTADNSSVSGKPCAPDNTQAHRRFASECSRAPFPSGQLCHPAGCPDLDLIVEPHTSADTLSEPWLQVKARLTGMRWKVFPMVVISVARRITREV